MNEVAVESIEEVESNEEQEQSFEEWEAAQGSDKEPDAEPVAQDDPDPKSEDGKEEPEPKPEEKQEPKTFKFKVDGEDREVPEAEVPTMLAKAAGADKVFRESADIRKEAGEFVEYMKANPIAALERLGLNFQEIAENHLFEKIKYDGMDESGRKAFDDASLVKTQARELQEFKDRDSQEREAAETKEREEQEQSQIAGQREVLKQQFQQALQTSGLPENKFTISRMAEYMREAAAQGQKASPIDVAERVKQDYAEMIEQARKADVNAYKSKGPQEQKPVTTSHKPVSKKTKRITSLYQLME